jgi:xanthine dehydrogenase accessory factor
MGEFVRITQEATKALARGETLCLATVVRVRGSSPRHSSARMLIWPDKKTVGTIGGGTFEHRVIDDACNALTDGQSIYETYIFDTTGRPGSVGLCGGSVEVHMEILRPDPVLVLIGAGHIAQPLAQMATLLDMKVMVVDDRSEWANDERFPDADQVHVVEYEEATETLSPIPVPITENSYVVIATWGYDLPALEQILPKDPAFIGLVASPTKAREFFKRLLAQGVSADSLRRIRTPLGLDIGAETAAEIALSILAEVLAIQRSTSGLPLKQKRGDVLDKLLSTKSD